MRGSYQPRKKKKVVRAKSVEGNRRSRAGELLVRDKEDWFDGNMEKRRWEARKTFSKEKFGWWLVLVVGWVVHGAVVGGGK